MKYSLTNIKELLSKPQWNYSFEPNGWFFCNDLVPHDTALKYACKRLYEQGKLERENHCGRWGYRYRVPKEAQKEVGK